MGKLAYGGSNLLLFMISGETKTRMGGRALVSEWAICLSTIRRVRSSRCSFSQSKKTSV